MVESPLLGCRCVIKLNVIYSGFVLGSYLQSAYQDIHISFHLYGKKRMVRVVQLEHSEAPRRQNGAHPLAIDVKNMLMSLIK
jgi:hypothetical protein